MKAGSGTLEQFKIRIANANDKCGKKRSQQLAQSNELATCRRPPSGAMKFAVGMVVCRSNFTGVIVSWDLLCNKSEEWLKKNGIHNLARGRYQPFYQVLFTDLNVDRDEYFAEGYLFEEN